MPCVEHANLQDSRGFKTTFGRQEAPPPIVADVEENAIARPGGAEEDATYAMAPRTPTLNARECDEPLFGTKEATDIAVPYKHGACCIDSARFAERPTDPYLTHARCAAVEPSLADVGGSEV